jgi:hypothetical protein
MAGKNIQTRGYWSTYGAITTTGTTTLIDPGPSDCVYLCYGYLDVRGSTTTKKINLCMASSTTVLWSVDATANNVGTHGLIFGDAGLRITADAALYLVIDATHSVQFAFTGFTSLE